MVRRRHDKIEDRKISTDVLKSEVIIIFFDLHITRLWITSGKVNPYSFTNLLLSQLQIFITVIDDDMFEEDEHFYVRLSNPRYMSPD